MDQLNRSFDEFLIESGDEVMEQGPDTPEDIVVLVSHSSGESDWESEEDSDTNDGGIQWTPNIGRQNNFDFQGSGVVYWMTMFYLPSTQYNFFGDFSQRSR